MTNLLIIGCIILVGSIITTSVNMALNTQMPKDTPQLNRVISRVVHLVYGAALGVAFVKAGILPISH
jgi:hypothetical protein